MRRTSLAEGNVEIGAQITLANDVLPLLRCPVCRSDLKRHAAWFECTNAQCGKTFPVVDGVPVLINEERSIFSIGDFVFRRATFYRSSPSRLTQFLRTLLPTIGQNIRAAGNYAKFTELLLKGRARPLVLVLGGSVVGQGMDGILSRPDIRFIESDVAFGPRTILICDGHDIPFASETFDGVIAQVVLEHVVDPYRCVDEIHRVLKTDGLVYAETAFMEQVHGGRCDFTRFTHLGHRRLFRRFDEIESGAACGPGMALAWSYRYFLLSFVRSRSARQCISAFSRLTSFWLKYFDYFLIDQPGALDAAPELYFLGQRTDRVLSDRELVRLFRGLA